MKNNNPFKLLIFSLIVVTTPACQEVNQSLNQINAEMNDLYPADALRIHLQPNLESPQRVTLNIQAMHSNPITILSISANNNQCRISPEINAENSIYLEQFKSREVYIQGCDFNNIVHLKFQTDKNDLEFGFQ